MRKKKRRKREEKRILPCAYLNTTAINNESIRRKKWVGVSTKTLRSYFILSSLTVKEKKK
jgi:hypothetical protein